MTGLIDVPHRWVSAALRFARRVLRAVTGALTAGGIAARVLLRRFAGSVQRAAAGIRARHEERMRVETSYRTTLAAGVAAAFGTVCPSPLLAAVIGVLLSERFSKRPAAVAGPNDDEPDDDQDDYLDRGRSWDTPRPRPSGPLWDRYPR